MRKKTKNDTFISRPEAIKILKEVQKVEKKRIVKSTLSNERSSRSHNMIILDVPTVGGRLMLVDTVESENIDQAGQTGFEAKMKYRDGITQHSVKTSTSGARQIIAMCHGLMCKRRVF